MNLQTIFDHFTYGELAQIALTNEGEGISEANRARVITNVNLGLTELHKRFLLKRGTLYVEIQSDQSIYILDNKYSESNTSSSQPVKFIKDLADPFKNDLLRIEQVLDATDVEQPLNEHGKTESLFTPSFNKLVFPSNVTEGTYKVVYRANHPQLTNIDAMYPPNLVDIQLPETHLEALLYYVASRILNPVGMMNEFHEGNNYYVKFEDACQRLENLNFRIDMVEDDDRFCNRGWV